MWSFVHKIFLLLGDTSAAKRTLKKAYKMHLGVNDTEQQRLADLLKNGQIHWFMFLVFLDLKTY